MLFLRSRYMLNRSFNNNSSMLNELRVERIISAWTTGILIENFFPITELF